MAMSEDQKATNSTTVDRDPFGLFPDQPIERPPTGFYKWPQFDPCPEHDPLPFGSGDNRVAVLRAAIWRAMMEIENDGANAAFETLQHAWENSR